MTEPLATPAVCWHCGGDISGHFCTDCNKIQPLAADSNYFSFFELPQHYHIDTAQLERRFYQLSRQFHPDFFGQTSEAEQQYSVACASMLNDAYRTLKDSLRRANYLLELQGIKSNQKAKTPADLLAEVFELNEQLEELREAKSANETSNMNSLKQQLRDMEGSLQERAEGLHNQMNTAFTRFDESGDRELKKAALTEVNEVLSQMNYINNLINDIEIELED